MALVKGNKNSVIAISVTTTITIILLLLVVTVINALLPEQEINPWEEVAIEFTVQILSCTVWVVTTPTMAR